MKTNKLILSVICLIICSMTSRHIHSAEASTYEPQLRKMIAPGIKLAQTGKFDQAIKSLQTAIKQAEETFGKDHVAVGMIYAGCGKINLLGKHDNEKAIFYYNKAIAILEKSAPEEMPFADALMRLGDIYFSMKQYSKAKPLYNKSYAIVNKNFGPKYPFAVEISKKLNIIKQKETK